MLRCLRRLYSCPSSLLVVLRWLQLPCWWLEWYAPIGRRVAHAPSILSCSIAQFPRSSLQSTFVSFFFRIGICMASSEQKRVHTLSSYSHTLCSDTSRRLNDATSGRKPAVKPNKERNQKRRATTRERTTLWWEVAVCPALDSEGRSPAASAYIDFT